MDPMHEPGHAAGAVGARPWSQLSFARRPPKKTRRGRHGANAPGDRWCPPRRRKPQWSRAFALSAAASCVANVLWRRRVACMPFISRARPPGHAACADGVATWPLGLRRAVIDSLAPCGHVACAWHCRHVACAMWIPIRGTDAQHPARRRRRRIEQGEHKRVSY